MTCTCGRTMYLIIRLWNYSRWGCTCGHTRYGPGMRDDRNGWDDVLAQARPASEPIPAVPAKGKQGRR